MKFYLSNNGREYELSSNMDTFIICEQLYEVAHIIKSFNDNDQQLFVCADYLEIEQLNTKMDDHFLVFYDAYTSEFEELVSHLKKLNIPLSIIC